MALAQTRRYKVPDHIRRGIRQAIGVGLATFLAYTLLKPLGGKGSSSDAAHQLEQAAKWAAITIVVLGNPILGKVAQVSMERTLGTVSGGLLGFATVMTGFLLGREQDALFTTATSTAVAFAGVLIGYHLKLDYSGKLFVMTFLLVTMASDEPGEAGWICFTRIGGIVAGVFLSLLLSMLVFPKSASMQATDNVELALEGLVQLAKLAWNTPSQPMATPPGTPKGAGPRGAPPLRGPGSSRKSVDRRHSVDFSHTNGAGPGASGGLPTEQQIAEREAECEKVLMDVYAKLGKCDECIPLSASEIYFRTLRRRWCFIPAVPLCCGEHGLCGRQGAWHLPRAEMAALSTCVRRTARVLWALHVTLQEGFTLEILNLLRKRYPSGLLTELQESSTQALEDMLAAFPRQETCPPGGLHRFVEAVAQLIKISDEQRCFLLTHLPSGGSSPSPAPSPPDALPAPTPTPAPVPVPSRCPSLRGAASTEGYTFGASRQASAALQTEDLPRGTGLLSGPGSRRRSLEEAPPATDSSRPHPQPPGGGGPSQPPGVATPSRLSRQGTASPLPGLAEGMQGAPEQGESRARDAGREAGAGVEQGAGGAPLVAGGGVSGGGGVAVPRGGLLGFDHAPAEALSRLGAGQGGDGLGRSGGATMGLVRLDEAGRLVSPAAGLEASARSVSFEKLDGFPASPAGYTSKVRWHSFQFLMGLLKEELEDMQDALQRVLRALPKPPKPRGGRPGEQGAEPLLPV